MGDHNDRHKAHLAIVNALSASGRAEGIWLATDSIPETDLREFHGLWCVPGMPYRSAEGALAAIQFARMSHTPFLGTSAGFQYALIEYARNVLGLAAADHQKINPGTPLPLISHLDAALAGVKARVRFAPGSRLQRSYRLPESLEEYHCSFGLNPRYRRFIQGGNLGVAAVDDHDDIRAVELDGHPFFVATLFQPEMKEPSPIVEAFLTAAERRRAGMTRAAS